MATVKVNSPTLFSREIRVLKSSLKSDKSSVEYLLTGIIRLSLKNDYKKDRFYSRHVVNILYFFPNI